MAIFSAFGQPDVLVNNAAFQRTHDSIEEFTTEEFDRTFKVVRRLFVFLASNDARHITGVVYGVTRGKSPD